MTTKRRYSLSETRIEEHLKLLEELDTLPLVDSCCDICHCDCYSSHRSEVVEESTHSASRIQKERKSVSCLNDEVEGKKIAKKKDRASSKPLASEPSSKSALPNEKSTILKPKQAPNEGENNLRKKRKQKKRSKSVCSRSQSQCSERHYTRDCEILQDLLTSLDDSHTPPLEIQGMCKESAKTMRTSKTPPPPPPTSASTKQTASSTKQTASSSHHFENSKTLAPVRLSESMANLCIVPTIRDAYQKVPAHDKRILNRMATKRNEQAVSKENAWLARKYWENERYERELLKCEQMEEYKKAVRDKQFQDYLQTKARLNEIAQRDLCELQRLRESLQQKDARTKKRLQNLRIERDMSVNQKRCEELRKAEHVNINQEELNLDEMLKKSEICQRLTERLKRADHIRNAMLDNYLKRLRYGNYIEQLQHEEHWRELQLSEKLKREQLKEEITRKRCRSQHFVEAKLKHNEALRKTAKLSKSLRDLVRSSVTPETGVMLYGGR
ncbi:capping protein inhibiting regulator of actin dynamics [Stomoxys calcitrans]|uniref:capping protein inhibiting regulator of actin dynamics n=1 Tax=Stomoxys calcitrans TaxID=35570 RepID=UPI0027E3A632|nr:capping protein inhibiting regulator of actin dynamics [Stomoxys calcitrans]